VLAQSLSKRLSNIQVGTAVKKVFLRRKEALLTSGETIKYDYLVNTIPLKNFMDTIADLPSFIRRDSKKLKSAGVLCLNLGIKRPRISRASWIYFPERKYIFYRIGFPMNFTPHVVPKGCSSMYVEIPMNAVKGLSQKEILKRTLAGLREAQILRKGDRIVVSQFLPIPHAYVVYDQNRRRSLPKIFSFLRKNNIQSIGRYGAWKYSFMEEAILDGKKAAEYIEASTN
jgi:protoporphyrinogen oxidase